MATQSPRDVALTLSVESIGTEGIERLRDDLAALAKKGGEASPQLAELAAQIDKLADQANLTTTMRELVNEVEQLGAVEQQSAAKAAELKTSLAELTGATQAARSGERDLKSEVMAAQRALFDKRQELAILKNETSAADKESSSYTNTVRQLNSEIIASKSELRNITEQYRLARESTREAAVAEAEFARGMNATTKEANDAQQALQNKQRALSEVRSSLTAAGVAAHELGAADKALATSYTELVTSVDQLRVKQDEATAAARRAAQEEERLALIQIASRRELEQAAAQEAQHILSDYAKMEAAQRQVGESARKAGQEITEAMGTIGVRGTREVRAEIDRVRSAMTKLAESGTMTGAELAGAMKKGEAQVKALEREIRALEGTLTLTDKAAMTFSSAMGQFAAGNLAAQAVMLLAQKIMDMGKAFVEAVVQVDQLRRGLGAIYNSADITAKQIDFLRKASMEAGVSVGAISGEFVKFSAAMKASNIPLEDGNNLFKAVTKASAQLGLGAEATAGALNALGQMASKGVVSMEELRQQLGDRLPGAMGLVADGLGITQAQLVKLVESGGLATRDFVVPFTAALNKMKGETDGLLPAWERFKTMLTTVAQTAGDSGWANIMAGALNLLGGTVGGVAIIISGFTESVFLAAKGVVAVAARLMGDKQAFTFFAEEVAKASERLQQQKDAFKAMINPASQAADETKKVGVQMKATAEEITLADRAARNMAEAHKLSGSAATIASDATLNLAGNIVKYNATVNARLAVLKTEVEAAQMSVKAAKEQGDEMVRLAKITGDTTKVHLAEAEASNLVAEAAGKLAAKTKEEVDLMVLQRQHIIDVNNSRGVSKEATEAETAELTKKIVKGQAELEQAQQSANAARAEALQRQLVAEALKDQSAKMYEYRQQVEALTKEVDALTERQKRGENVDAALKEAREKLAVATNRYRDSIEDVIRAIDRETQKKKATLTVDEQLSTAAEKHYLALAKEAKAMGDTTLARQYEAAAIGEQIKAIQKKIEIAELELAAEEKRLKMQRALLTGDDDATRAKREQIDIELKLLEGKRAGIQGLRDEIAERERERQAILNGNDARASELKARDANIAAMNAETAALKEQNDAIENNNKEKQRAIDLENKRLGRDSEGFSVGPDGKRIVATYTTYSERAIYERAKQAGLSEAQALEIAQRYINQDQAPNLRGYGGGPTQTWDARLTEDINKLVLANARAKANSEKGVDQYGNPLPKPSGSEQGRAGSWGGQEGLVGSSGGQGAQQGGGSSGTGSSHTVNINMNGSQRTLALASQADANSLVDILKTLGNAAGRAQ